MISGPDAETLMDTTQTRNLLIDELLEVQAGFISIVLLSYKRTMEGCAFDSLLLPKTAIR